MNVLNYLMSIKADIGEFSVEENHAKKTMTVRSTRALTNEQKQELWKHVVGLDIQYIVTVGK
ncbi:MAG: hypothetical protein OEW15_11520 [Nitrospirota bacterium]|nr:hypothetical protein [Nitrospirota bacterium]